MSKRSSKRLRLAGAGLALAVLVACGSDEGAKPSDATAPPADAGPRTTVSAQTGPTGCPNPNAPPPTGEQATQCLYAASKEGNRERAAAVATPEAVTSLFKERWSPPDASFIPCTGGQQPGEELCTFDYHGATYLVDLRRQGNGWRATQVQGPIGGE